MRYGMMQDRKMGIPVTGQRQEDCLGNNPKAIDDEYEKKKCVNKYS